MKDLIDIGADPQRIIFGQTVKQNSHLKYAKDNNIGYVAFDSAFELHKIRYLTRSLAILLVLSIPYFLTESKNKEKS